MRKVIAFCGAIGGKVRLLPGESEQEALARAEAGILKYLDYSAKRFEVNVGLEIDEVATGDLSDNEVAK